MIVFVPVWLSQPRLQHLANPHAVRCRPGWRGHCLSSKAST